MGYTQMFLICRCFLFILVLKYFLREMTYSLQLKLEALAFYDHAGARNNKVTLTAKEFNISVATMGRWLAQRKKFQEKFPGQEFPIQKFWLKIKVKHVQFVYNRLLKTNEITSIRLLPDDPTGLKINFSKLTIDLNLEFETNFCKESTKSIIAHIRFSKKVVLDKLGTNCSEETFLKNFMSHLILKCKDHESFLAEQ
uniref:Uncharacterized protein n=1 Tax=Surirella sp. TaxID=1526603 RepID=A0A2R4A3K2_9STRA|nr:hypothetical protein [Surirella sp.]